MGTGTDIGILTTILFIFVGLGLILPFIHAGLDSDETNIDTDGIESAVSQDVTILGIIGSVAGMFFWTFGSLPIIIDGFFVVIRIVFYVILFKVIRGS